MARGESTRGSAKTKKAPKGFFVLVAPTRNCSLSRKGDIYWLGIEGEKAELGRNVIDRFEIILWVRFEYCKVS